MIRCGLTKYARWTLRRDRSGVRDDRRKAESGRIPRRLGVRRAGLLIRYREDQSPFEIVHRVLKLPKSTRKCKLPAREAPNRAIDQEVTMDAQASDGGIIVANHTESHLHFDRSGR